MSSEQKGCNKKQTRDTRDCLLDTAETLMCEQGYAAVTSRRLAEKAGVTSPLIHYYFSSMDELFVALYQRHATKSLSRLEQQLQYGNVIETLWNQLRSSEDAVFLMEFMAMSNHRKAVHEVMVSYAQQYRSIQHKALKKHLKSQGLTPSISPDAAVLLMAGTGFLIGLESRFNMTFGHKNAEKIITQMLNAN